jgi:hypothetical protein
VRPTPRKAALALAAAVLLPVLPATAAAAAPPAAVAPTTSASATADWHVRHAAALSTLAHLAGKRAEQAARAARNAAPADRARLRAAADWAARDARAKATQAHLARKKRDQVVAAARPVQRASRDAAGRTAATPTGVWDRLAQCESNGNWRINTGNGYYGGLQFSASSWRAVGGSGLPHQASREEQIRRGELLKAKQGWGAWPACTRKLGLR